MVGRKFKTREIVLGLLALVFVILVVTFYIWHQAESIRLGYQTRELEGDIASIKKDIEQLEAEKAFLLSLERVEKIATQTLKMRSPEDKQIVYHESAEKAKKE